MLEEQDVDIMSWAHGTAEPPERFAGPMMDGPEEARLYPDRAMSEPLQRVLRAKQSLTLAGVPTGFLPWLAADLARAAHGTGDGGRAVVVVADEAAMRALADTVPLFAPEVEVRTFRAGTACHTTVPPLRSGSWPSGWRLLARFRSSAKPQLLVATASAATQRLLTPFRIRQLTRQIAEGERIEREGPIEQLNSLGYQRVDTVAEHGEYSVRGSLIDLFPAGEHLALRLDFFGDEIESLRRFDPADQRSTDKSKAFTLMPASEALLDADSIKRFRSRYREKFGATATQDPLYQALSEGRRMSGMEHWLPLLEERLETLFDHLGDERHRDPRRRGRSSGWRPSRGDRGLLPESRARDGGRAWKLPPARAARALSLQEGVGMAEADRPIHLASPFHEPGSERVIEFGVESARDFAPERAQQANVYEAVAKHVGDLGRTGHKVVLASYTRGARERLSGLLEDHGLKAQKLAESWQEALGSKTAPPCSCSHSTMASRLPTLRFSPSRTCLATASSVAERGKPLQRSSRSLLRCRPAISSFTPTTASAATKA